MSKKINKEIIIDASLRDREDRLNILRHSTAHLLAHAVTRLYPNVKVAIGPSIKNGFYYDFDFGNENISVDDLGKIEKEMYKIVKENLKIERIESSKAEAKKIFSNLKNVQDYKLELIDLIPDDEGVTVYSQGDFCDLCRGPHVENTGSLKVFKLLNTGGAYWHGDSNNKMLTRIYGTAFETAEELDSHLNMLEEAKRRDHRKLGKELNLFMFSQCAPGMPFFLPNGVILRNLLENLWKKEHARHGYYEIRTPMILNQDLWKQSGHYEHYKENMYSTLVDDVEFSVKPMNCPGSILIYKNALHSYREFPIRMAELGLVHRHEDSGVLHGLMRVRCFTQDDAHIFALPNQIEEEIIKVIDLVNYFYCLFGFKYHIELSTRPENSMGTDEEWNSAIQSLKNALDRKNNMNYVINEGDGAFYGPKIDFHLEDCLGRTWQCGTIQLDFQMPERFDLNYIDRDNEKKRPIMIHRTVFGSIERFIGILIENTAGHLPLWISPVQVRILPVSEAQHEYARMIFNKLANENVRVEIDISDEKLGYKVRNFIQNKIPCGLIIGRNEVENGTVTLKEYGNENQIEMSSLEFIDYIKKQTI